MKVTSNLIDGLPFEWETPSENVITQELQYVATYPRCAALRLVELQRRFQGLERAIKERIADE